MPKRTRANEEERTDRGMGSWWAALVSLFRPKKRLRPQATDAQTEELGRWNEVQHERKEDSLSKLDKLVKEGCFSYNSQVPNERTVDELAECRVKKEGNETVVATKDIHRSENIQEGSYSNQVTGIRYRDIKTTTFDGVANNLPSLDPGVDHAAEIVDNVDKPDELDEIGEESDLRNCTIESLKFGNENTERPLLGTPTDTPGPEQRAVDKYDKLNLSASPECSDFFRAHLGNTVQHRAQETVEAGNKEEKMLYETQEDGAAGGTVAQTEHFDAEDEKNGLKAPSRRNVGKDGMGSGDEVANDDYEVDQDIEEKLGDIGDFKENLEEDIQDKFQDEYEVRDENEEDVDNQKEFPDGVDGAEAVPSNAEEYEEEDSDHSEEEPDSMEELFDDDDLESTEELTRDDNSVIVIDDSDEDEGPVSHAEIVPASAPAASSKVLTPRRMQLSTPHSALSHPSAVAPRASHFGMTYGTPHVAVSLSVPKTPHHTLPSKTLFRASGKTPQGRRTVSSLTMRRKAPLAMEEFKAGVRVRQQARITSMIRDTYRAMRQGTESLSFEDFSALVKKRTHVQRLMDLDTLRLQPLDKPLDEAEYTQRTLEVLKRRAAAAKARLPPRTVPEEAQLQAIRDSRNRRRQMKGVLGRSPLPSQLPKKADSCVDMAFQTPGVVASMKGAQVSAHDLVKLQPCRWLNDEVINFYGALIAQRSESGAPGLWDVHVFSSFFWQNLTTRGYAGVRRWTRRVDIFTKDAVLIPINVGQAHWVCAVIQLRLRRFEYYDSMGIPSPGVFERLRAYLCDELKDKKQLFIDLSDWEDYFGGDASPQQENGYDCGVFAVQTLEQLSRYDPALPRYPPLNAADFTHPADAQTLRLIREEHAGDYAWNFAQSNMPYLRRRMVYEIVNKELMT